MASKEISKRIAAVAVMSFGAGLFIAVLHASKSSSVVLARWTQPAEINYHSFDPYTLFVLRNERGLFWSTTTHEARIVRGTDASGYGHYVDLDLSFLEDSSSIAKSTVTWSDDGVTLAVVSGHRFFFPKRAFIGGR
jgi:hypothetical protein